MQNQVNAGSIIIVDNDSDDRFLFELALKDSPLAARVVFITEVQEFENFLSQLTKPPDSPPALILINPFMTGIKENKALELMRANQKLISIPIALMLDSTLEIEFLKLDNAVRYLVKPITLYQIEQLLF